jgi:hypothetical protein
MTPFDIGLFIFLSINIPASFFFLKKMNEDKLYEEYRQWLTTELNPKDFNPLRDIFVSYNAPNLILGKGALYLPFKYKKYDVEIRRVRKTEALLSNRIYIIETKLK